MKRKYSEIIYYTLLWLFTILLYSATVFFYTDSPFREVVIDSGLFSISLLIVGVSMFFAIRYMDVGIKRFTERTLAHFFAASIGALFIIYFSKGYYNNLNIEWSVPWEDIAVIKTFYAYIDYLSVILIFYLVKYQKYKDEKTKREEELRSLLNDTELNLLKLQLNPHFLFNSLNSINSLTITDPKGAQEMIVKLSDFLRYSLGRHSNEKITLKDELDNVKLYLDIEKVRFGEKLGVKYTVDSDAEKILLPAMILQPLFENAVKYSMYDTLDKSVIGFKAKLSNKLLKIELVNNFDPEDDSSKGKGIGLSNVSRRLKLNYGEGAKIEKRIEGNRYYLVIEIAVQS